MCDIVYTLGGGSHWQDNELRYSLRSIEKHISNVDNVFIVGRVPNYLKNVVHLPYEDIHPCKETNIYLKLLHACQHPGVSDQFLFFNDDHFILQDFKADEFPFYCKGDLSFTVKNLPDYNKYRVSVEMTMKMLYSLKLKTDNFDTHTPIIYDKQKFIEVMTKYDWSNRFGYVVKSLYANSLKIDGVKEPDCKLVSPMEKENIFNAIKDRKVWSIGDTALGTGLQQALDELYPTPSRWEN